VRVIQLSDTHLATSAGIPEPMQSLIDWIASDPPDLVVHSGDIVFEDPDDPGDRRFSRAVMSTLSCPFVAIPGNHDVGFFEADHFARRLDTFRQTWGDDRFVVDADGWRLIGVDVYAVGSPDDDDWLRAALDTSDPVAAFVHQPLAAEPADGWQLPEEVRARFAQQLVVSKVRVLASGHRHCAATRRPTDPTSEPTHVWAPSATLTGHRYHDGDPSPGAVDYRFERDGSWSHRFVTAAAVS
jgi:alkaline phosphatase D